MTAMTTEELAVLGSAKGKVLKSLECVCDMHDDMLVWCVARLNFGRSAIEATTLLEAISYFGDVEDGGVFRCRLADLKVPFDPMIVESTRPRSAHKYLIDEKVLSVEVVHEHVVDPADGATFDSDIAIVLRTPWRAVALSRGIWFEEYMVVHLDLPPDVNAKAIQPLDMNWDLRDVAEPSLIIEREVIVL